MILCVLVYCVLSAAYGVINDETMIGRWNSLESTNGGCSDAPSINAVKGRLDKL